MHTSIPKRYVTVFRFCSCRWLKIYIYKVACILVTLNSRYLCLSASLLSCVANGILYIWAYCAQFQPLTKNGMAHSCSSSPFHLAAHNWVYMHLVLNDGVMAWHCKVSHMTFEMVGDHHQAVCVFVCVCNSRNVRLGFRHCDNNLNKANTHNGCPSNWAHWAYAVVHIRRTKHLHFVYNAEKKTFSLS